MPQLLERRLLFVREHAGLLKLTDTYDLLDPQTSEVVGLVRENVSGLIKALRLLISKSLMPTRIEVSVAPDQRPVLVLKRGITLLRARVDVLDYEDRCIGDVTSKIFSLGGGFHVFTKEGQRVAEVRGDWKGWNFKLLDAAGAELGTVTKKWGGLGRELFTSADNYIIEVRDGTSSNALVLAAALAIDLVFKEKN
jgi:uncharacterized protein YxjI